MDGQRTFLINGARHEFSPWAAPPKIRRMTVDDLRIVFRPIGMHGGTAFKVPPDGSPAFSALGTPDHWAETRKVHARRAPVTFTHTVGSNSIITGRRSPGYVRRQDVFPAEVMSEDMRSAWLERAIIRPVGTFEDGRFVPDKWFEDELNRYVWDANNERFEREKKTVWEEGDNATVQS